VAVQMATEFPIGALVLQGGFTSIPDVAVRQYPFIPIFNALLRDHFDNLLKIGLVTVPLLVLHGTADKVIPLNLAQRLYRAARNPKQHRWHPGVDHDPLMSQTPPEVKRFLKAQGLIP